jgi:hypothetical protein
MMPKLCLYKLKKIPSGISLDELQASHFSKAPVAGFLETVTGKPPRQNGTVKLMYNRCSLYAFFDLDEDSPVATLTQHDAELYRENVVELFIDPLGLGKVYYELQVNPLNASFDAIIINDILKGKRRGPRFQGFTGWDPKSFRHRSIVTPGKWQVFLSIDFADLFFAKHHPPKKGDAWRANLLRIDFDGKEQLFTAWSPTYVLDFHNTSRFGTWVFD